MLSKLHTHFYRLMAVFLVAAFVAQCAWFIARNSLTHDEGIYITTGYYYFAEGDLRHNRSHPPLTKFIIGAPEYFFGGPHPTLRELWEGKKTENAIARAFLDQPREIFFAIVNRARAVNVLWGLLTLLLCWQWSRRLFGKNAALFALALAAFDPLLIAFSGQATPDAGGACLFAVTLYALWEYTQRPTRAKVIAIGIALGTACASRHTSLLLIAFLPIAIALSDRKSNRTAALSLLVMLSIALATFTLCYRGQITAWVMGLQRQALHVETGHATYFAGECSKVGSWLYYPVAFLIKTPLVTAVLGVIGLLCLPLRARRNATFFGISTLALGVVLTLVGINVGVRYLLPIYPLLFIAASRFVAPDASRRVRFVAGALGVWSLFCVLHAGPSYLSYSNIPRFFGSLDAVLSDSNVDSGQALPQLAEFLKQRGKPSTYLSFFGQGQPSFYDVDAERLPLAEIEPDQKRRLRQVQGIFKPDDRTLWAVSATLKSRLQCTEPFWKRWFATRQPLAQPGDAISVYDLRDAEAYYHLALRQFGVQRYTTARLLLNRSLELAPNSLPAIALREREWPEDPVIDDKMSPSSSRAP